MRVRLLFLTVVLGLVTFSQAQSGGCGDVHASETVKNILSGTASFSAGWQEKIVNRMGDRAAVSVLKATTIEQLARPDIAEKILEIFGEAFARPEIVTVEEDRTPEVTNFLLSYLAQNVHDPGIQAKIAETSRYVRQQTEEYQKRKR